MHPHFLFELHPHLLPCLVMTEYGWILDHPLIRLIPFGQKMIKTANKNYVALRREADKSMASKDWATFIFLHVRPYRPSTLARIAPLMNDHDYWRLLGDVYVDGEGIGVQRKLWRRLLTAKRPGRESMTNTAEQQALAAMPERISVFRGYQRSAYARGWSWTTDRAKAEWFARRWEGGRPSLVSGEVKKAHVVAFFTRRNESEIVADPTSVRILAKERV